MTTRQLSDVDIARYVMQAGWANWELVDVVQALLAEHGGDAYAIYVNSDDSVDVGLYALNTKWIPEPTLAERLDPVRAGVWARRYWLRWFTRPDVLAIPKYSGPDGRLAYVLHNMWHASATPRYAPLLARATAAVRANGVVL